LITGATDDVGKTIAAELASRSVSSSSLRGMRANAAAVKLEIADRTGRDVRILLGDLASLSAMCQLADAFKRRYRGSTCS